MRNMGMTQVIGDSAICWCTAGVGLLRRHFRHLNSLKFDRIKSKNAYFCGWLGKRGVFMDKYWLFSTCANFRVGANSGDSIFEYGRFYP